jgi:hypothetical protein
MRPSFFSKAASGPVLSRDEFARQGRAVRTATVAFPDAEAVRCFLNSHHSALGGRPLDLAVASATGLAAVESAIFAESCKTGPGPQPKGDGS